MEDKLISFETAELAKKKGFKLQSNPFGYITKFYNHNTKTLLAYGRTGKTDLSKAYYASTQSLLQKWLREVHNISVTIDSHLKHTVILNYFVMVYDIENHKIHREKIYYDTYEEALEIGLQEALKLIK